MRNLDKKSVKVPMDNLPAYNMDNAPRWSSFSRSVYGDPMGGGSIGGSFDALSDGAGDDAMKQFTASGNTSSSTTTSSISGGATEPLIPHNKKNKNDNDDNTYSKSRSNSITF